VINWDEPDERQAFEAAAIEAARGYIETLAQLREALEANARLAKLLEAALATSRS
jgi:hypothetical protein